MEYKKIQSIDELRGKFVMDLVDLSNLDLRDSGCLFNGPMTYQDTDLVKAWTDRVMWPNANKLPEGFNPAQLLENCKAPNAGILDLHKKGITGQGIGIAIIDQTLNINHPDYKDNIVLNENCADNWDINNASYHGSLVVGNAVGRSTGIAPGADIYFFAANNWIHDDNGRIREDIRTNKYNNDAIRRVLKINKTLPQDKKIRFLSCSWGVGDNWAKFGDETVELLDDCQKQGILSLASGYKNIRDFQSYSQINNSIPVKISPEWTVCPTDDKTTPWYEGGFIFNRLGGLSSVIPHIAGLGALALQNNPEFATQSNWQDMLIKVMHDTAIKSTNMENSVINPVGILSEISRMSKSLRFGAASNNIIDKAVIDNHIKNKLQND